MALCVNVFSIGLLLSHSLFCKVILEISVNLYKEYSYLILNKLEGLPCFGVMIWQPSYCRGLHRFAYLGNSL